MTKIKSSQVLKSFRYSFAVNGGAVGSIRMGEFVVAGSAWLGTVVTARGNFMGGGGTTIEIGTASLTNMFFVQTNIANTPGAIGDTQSFVPTNLTAITQLYNTIPATEEILFTIGTAPVTAGILDCTIYVIEY